MGFGQGLSGLKAASQNLDVIGNNIANANTVGFKASSVAFADMYASSRVGLGVQVASINQRFSMGNLRSGGGALDMAIDGENGLFRLQRPNGQTVFSRNGQFIADKDNYIVNAQGARLTGYIGDNAELVPLRVPTGNMAPSATREATTSANLDANAPIISEVDVPEVLGQVTLTDTVTATALPAANYRISSTGSVSWVDGAGNPVAAPPDGDYTSGGGTPVRLQGGQIVSGAFDTGAPNVAYEPPLTGRPFSPADPRSFTHSLPMTVYDSLGNSHQMTQYFVRRSGTTGTESEWQVYYTLDGKAFDTPAAGGPVDMQFDSAGRMISDAEISLVFNQPGSMDAPAEALTIALDYSGSTQFGGAFNPSFTQNGFATGEFSGVTISNTGELIAAYTNGETVVAGNIALADFANKQGLSPVGDNAWVETGESGQPRVGRPGEMGLAYVRGQTLEESNVDMSEELVSMIIAQRTYQANTQTLKTQDQVLQTLMQLR